MIGAWIGFGCGVFVVAGTLASVVGSLLVPRGLYSRISRVVDAVVDALLAPPLRWSHSYRARDRILAWQAPTSLLLRLAGWMALLLFGYALLMLPAARGDLGLALASSGSSMFTLGYAMPDGAERTVVDYLAAFTGVVVIGLQVGYLPTLYSCFHSRETEVSMLISRGGQPAWGPEILARTTWGMFGGEVTELLDRMFADWERWAAMVAESHTIYPALIRVRSLRPGSYWLTSLIAVMDAAALHLALAPSRDPKLTPRLVLRMGFVVLERISGALRMPIPVATDPDREIAVPYRAFADAVHELDRLGFPMERTAEQAWPHYLSWRADYDEMATALAHRLDAPPTPWTGPRRWPTDPSPSDALARLARNAEVRRCR